MGLIYLSKKSYPPQGSKISPLQSISASFLFLGPPKNPLQNGPGILQRRRSVRRGLYHDLYTEGPEVGDDEFHRGPKKGDRKTKKTKKQKGSVLGNGKWDPLQKNSGKFVWLVK